eukprot:TRINITY_DN1661_c1_g1_i1.p1 TRINITY_DN1661_c1_g1~~TRINITY_DN1661_c1_g1_i1.p1  ORF type:complete len:163 (+),score=44.88 TRINITY_DN1661_c1_g1_i1:3-491(+)
MFGGMGGLPGMMGGMVPMPYGAYGGGPQHATGMPTIKQVPRELPDYDPAVQRSALYASADGAELLQRVVQSLTTGGEMPLAVLIGRICYSGPTDADGNPSMNRRRIESVIGNCSPQAFADFARAYPHQLTVAREAREAGHPQWYISLAGAPQQWQQPQEAGM